MVTDSLLPAPRALLDPAFEQSRHGAGAGGGGGPDMYPRSSQLSQRPDPKSAGLWVQVGGVGGGCLAQGSADLLLLECTQTRRGGGADTQACMCDLCIIHGLRWLWPG